MEYKLRKSLFGITISFSLLALSAQAQTPTFTAATVLNDASMVSGPIAPGMVVAITGSNLGDTFATHNCSSTNPVPNICVGTSVLVNGAAAPVLTSGAAEVTFQVPFNLSGGTATIQVTSNQSGSTLSSAVVTVPVAPTAPGLFSNAAGTGYYFDTSVSGLTPTPSAPVNIGDTVALYGTGFGVTNPAVATGVPGPAGGAMATATVTLTINNQSVPVTFGGLGSGTLGWDEVIFTVPSTLTVPIGNVTASFPMVVTVGGVASQAVNLIVNAPGLSLTKISPSPVPLSANPQTVTFTGTGFQAGLTLKLEAPGSTVVTTVPSANITIVSSTQFTAQITVGTTAGTWSAIVTDTNGDDSNIFTFLASGTGPTGPTITSIVTTSSGAPEISQNAWIEVHGANLAQITTTWSNSSFLTGLPTTLGGVTATVDGLPAAIFYVSSTQVNILAPLDVATGMVAVQLNTPLGQTPVATVNEVPTAPAFLVVDTGGHVAAQHFPSYDLLGPASLDQPGYNFTPAVPGENVIIYTTGFGQTSPPFTNQLINTGFPNADPFPISLGTLPQVTIGNLPATVSFAGLAGPGLYQINLTIPPSAPAGDLPILATYNGSSTQSNAVITVQ
jgi:uncharacterized protein (TIGR03437 family)